MNPTAASTDLKGLRDIQVPDAVSWMPQTDAWYVLFGLAAVVILLAAIRFWVRWKRNAYRREALKELEVIEAQCAHESGRLAGLPRIPELVRKTALAAYSRQQVAGLSGDKWLSYLEKTAPGCGMGVPAGQLLNVVAYAPPASLAGLTDAQTRLLISSAKSWIRRHRA
ncbi:MAG: DUF4381 domain-containing protein [Acidobacteria bacterium]|nr:DUF4381 domain-containing protein [Acidobacteriota bacterium]